MSALEYLFKSSWCAGIILFTERKDSSILEDAFQTACAMCSPEHDLIQITLRANRILLDRIIARNEPTAEKELEEIGNDLVKLIQIR